MAVALPAWGSAMNAGFEEAMGMVVSLGLERAGSEGLGSLIGNSQMPPVLYSKPPNAREY